MFENCRNWTISSEASRNGRTFTDYPAREQDKSDTLIRNNLNLLNMIQRLEDKYRAGIYVIQNNVNSKKYVGKSKDIYKRIMQHVTLLNTKSKDENRHLINAWHKYGRSSFTYYVIEYIYEEDSQKLEEKLAERELYWMQQLHTLDRNSGYNLRLDSEGKCIVSDETRQKLSEANKKRYENPEERIKASAKIKEIRKKYKEKFDASYDKVAKTRRKYKIAQCDLSGNVLRVYEIIGDILKEHPDYYKQAIKGCCQGTKRSYKGYRWHYCDLETEELILKGMFNKL